MTGSGASGERGVVASVAGEHGEGTNGPGERRAGQLPAGPTHPRLPEPSVRGHRHGPAQHSRLGHAWPVRPPRDVPRHQRLPPPARHLSQLVRDDRSGDSRPAHRRQPAGHRLRPNQARRDDGRRMARARARHAGSTAVGLLLVRHHPARRPLHVLHQHRSRAHRRDVHGLGARGDPHDVRGAGGGSRADPAARRGQLRRLLRPPAAVAVAA